MENDPPETVEISRADVGRLVHVIKASQEAGQKWAAEQTQAEMYEALGARWVEEARRHRAKAEELEISVRFANVDVTQWLAKHLPPPICPDGSCSGATE